MDIRKMEDEVLEQVDALQEEPKKRHYNISPEKLAQKNARIADSMKRKRDAKTGEVITGEALAASLKEKSKDAMEKGYQKTVRIQLNQIRELNEIVDAMSTDVMTLKNERDALAEGLLTVRASIDRLHALLHDGEEEA